MGAGEGGRRELGCGIIAGEGGTGNAARRYLNGGSWKRGRRVAATEEGKREKEEGKVPGAGKRANNNIRPRLNPRTIRRAT